MYSGASGDGTDVVTSVVSFGGLNLNCIKQDFIGVSTYSSIVSSYTHHDPFLLSTSIVGFIDVIVTIGSVILWNLTTIEFT